MLRCDCTGGEIINCCHSFSPENDAEEGGATGEFIVTEEEKTEGSQNNSETVAKDESRVKDEADQSQATTPAQPKKKRNRNRKKGGGGNNGVPAVVQNEQTSAPVADKQKKKKETISKPPIVAVKNGRGVVKAKKAFNKSTQKKLHKNIKELDKKDATHISENRLRALGINPKKYQSKLLYGNSNE